MSKVDQKDEVFQREIEYLETAKEVVNTTSLDLKALKDQYVDLCSKYERLIGEATILTSISDRLHHKLNYANEKLKKQSDEINTINQDLKVSNQILQDTIDQLVKAKVGRKAGTIVLTIAIMLFIISEGFLEPLVEQSTDSFWVGFFFKLGIAVLLKPIDVVVEKYLMQQTLKKREMAYIN